MSGLVCTHCGRKVSAATAECPSCGGTSFATDPDASDASDASTPTIAPSRAGGGGAVTLGIVAAVAVVGLACAGGLLALTLAPSSPSRSSEPGPPVAVEAVAPATGFAALRDRGAVRVAVDADAPPFMSRSGDGWEGFEFALMSAIAENAKVKLEIVPTPYDDILPAVASGSAELGVAQLPPQSRDGVSFSRSYLQYSLCLVVRADSPATRLRQVKRIGMYHDPTAMALAGSAANPVFYDDSGYYADVAAGKIDAMLYDCPLARYELSHDPVGSKLKIANDHLGVGTYSIAVTDTVPGLLADVDAALGDLGTSGIFPALVTRWLGQGPVAADDESGRGVVVAAGESLGDVATRAGVKADDLVQWNADILGSGKPVVYAGMLLRVR